MNKYELVQLLSLIVFVVGLFSLAVLFLYEQREIIVKCFGDLFSDVYLFVVTASLLMQVSIIVSIITIFSLIILYFSIVLEESE